MSLKLLSLMICVHVMRQGLCNFLPEIACPSYFGYKSERNRLYGQVTLPHLNGDITKLDVELTQRTPVTNGYFGSIALAGTEDDIRHDKPVMYRIEFPTAREVPKLVKISVNGDIVCIGSDSEYETATSLYLQHNLTYHSGEVPSNTPMSVWRNGNSLNQPSDLFRPVGATGSKPTTTQPTEASDMAFGATGKNSFDPRILDDDPPGSFRRPLLPVSNGRQRNFSSPTANLAVFPFSLPETQLPKQRPNARATDLRYRQQSRPLPSTSPSTTSLRTIADPRISASGFDDRFGVASMSIPKQGQRKNVKSTAAVSSDLFGPVGAFSTSSSSNSPLIDDKPTAFRCGQEYRQFTPFIYGGHATTRGQMPWIAPLYRKDQGNLHFLCSGSLISANTVVTAAHCIVNYFRLTINQIVVYLGRYDLDNYSEDGYEIRELKNYLVHPEYREVKLSDADVALLILKQPVTFTKFIAPVCLWEESLLNLKDDKRETSFVAGWGADETSYALSSVPKMVALRIVSNAECSSYPEYADFITSRTLCASNSNGYGPCLGDSGAGLITSYNQTWFLRATVSGGLKSGQPCERQKFVVYCDLAKHIQWIRRNMEE